MAIDMRLMQADFEIEYRGRSYVVSVEPKTSYYRYAVIVDGVFLDAAVRSVKPNYTVCQSVIKQVLKVKK